MYVRRSWSFILAATVGLIAWAGPVAAVLPSQGEEDVSELTRAERHNNLGTQYASRGDIRQAAGEFRKAIELDPSMTIAHYNLGLALSRVQNYEDAVFAFQSALRLSPRYFDGWFQIGLGLMALDKFAEAATAFEECLTLRPRNPAARFRLGQSYWKASKWQNVIAQWDSLLNETPGHPSTEVVRNELPRAYYNVGLDHQGAGEPALARATYEEALRLDAHYVPALNNLAILKHAEGETESAVELFLQVLEIESDHDGARMGLAGALLVQERPQEALAHYLELRKTTPNDVRVYRGLALSHLKLGQTEKAIAWSEKAQKGSDPYAALLLKAFVLEHNASGDRYGSGYDESTAQETYRGIISRYPDRPQAYYNLGIIHARAGRWPDAVAKFGHALSVDSTYVDARTALDEVERVMKLQNTQLLRIKRP